MSSGGGPSQLPSGDSTDVLLKDRVVEILVDALNPGGRVETLRRFVNYYFAHEKKKESLEITSAELTSIYDKAKISITQNVIANRRRIKKLYSSRNLKDETEICATHRAHGKPQGTRGWVDGWLTTYPSDAHVDLQLDSPMVVTRMMVYAVNVKASPTSMELYAKDEATNEWSLVRGFNLRRRDYEGSHGVHEYNKFEMFYVLGHASNQQEYSKDNWEVHPLSGPGETTAGSPDHYMSSKYWRWRIVDSNGAGYVGINNFILYGREPGIPAPTNVQAEAFETGAKIRWDTVRDSSNISLFHVIAHPGSMTHHSNGSFYESCAGTESRFLFPDLCPGNSYQFQVVAVDAEGNEGIPSKASNIITVAQRTPHKKDTSFQQISSRELADDAAKRSLGEYQSLYGLGTTLLPQLQLKIDAVVYL